MFKSTSSSAHNYELLDLRELNAIHFYICEELMPNL